MASNLLNLADNARKESLKKLKNLPPLKIKREPSTEDSFISSPSTSKTNPQTGIDDNESVGFNEFNPLSQSPDLQSISRKSIGEISNDIRENIRKKAKTALEDKRGSIQLQKRLLRNKTLSTNIPKQIFENDGDKMDSQIERVIKLGEKYETKKESNNVIDSEIENRFVSGYFDRDLIQDNNDILFEYAPGIPINIDIEEVKKMIVIMKEKFTMDDLESGNFNYDVKNKNINKLRQRLPKKFITNNNSILGIDENEFCERKVLKYDRAEWEERSLIENVWGINKDSQLIGGSSYKKNHYENVKIYLSKVKLHHHWLFSKEHVLCRKVEEVYEILLYKATVILKDIKIYLTSKSIDDDISEIEKKIDDEVNKYGKCCDEIQLHWENLCNLRNEQGYQRTSLTLTVKDVEEQDLSIFTSVIQNFYRNPIFSITYDKENIKIYDKKEPAEGDPDHIPTKKEIETEKDFENYFMSLKKCEWEAQILFNNIFVCRTQQKCINKNFEIVFNEEYNLSVHDVPESIVIVLCERFNRGVYRVIAKVGIPLEKEDENSDNISSNHFASDIVYESLGGTVGAGGVGREPLSGLLFTKLDGYGILTGEEVKERNDKLNHLSDNGDFQLIPSETRLDNSDLNEDDARITALRMRFLKNQLLGSVEKPIPIYASEMQGKLNRVEELTLEEYGRFGFGIENLKLSSLHYAIKLRTELMQNMESNKRKIKTYSDIVKEETIPNLFSGFSTLFGNRDVSRKLKPMRNEIKKHVTSGIFKFKFIINIQSATNLGEKIDGTPIESFVEITFQSQVFKSKISPGKNPKWQETIIITFDNTSLENKNLNSIVEKFTIRIYDYITVPLKHDDREINTIHEQIEFRYLAKTEIPFYTIYMNGKIDGLLPLHRTTFCNGYTFEGNSYLKLMISLDPLIASPVHENISTNVSIEEDNVIQKYISWKKRCQTLYPNRKYKGLVFNSQGKSLLPSRYIHAVKPPLLLDYLVDDKLNLIKKAIDIVKCLPTIEDPVMFPGILDLWTNIDQTLTIGCGDEEEHALMLICWLKYYQIDGFLVLGNALPEGLRTAYVIVQLEDKLYIINPVEGFIWDIKDAYVPILSIGTIVTDKNIYGNIQKHEQPHYMIFDFSREDCWKKMFDNDVPESKFITVQNEAILYQNINDSLVIELKSSLERDAKAKIDELRQHGIPQWNILVARTLKDILSDISVIDNSKEIEKRLYDNFGSIFKINAIILKIPFISRKQIISEILSTKIHLNSDIGVQFAISIHLVPFMNNILQCNVGLASLIPV
uniref:C2 domain-containing protein n=1 Tax=Strongyloides venezuelensis TaxID=75913 RepID=A0A0K0G2Z2_STRVS